MEQYAELSNDELLQMYESESFHLGGWTEALDQCANAGYSTVRYESTYRERSDRLNTIKEVILERMESSGE